MPRVEAPTGNAGLHPLSVDRLNEKLKSEIGWQPTKTTREVFLETMRVKGLLKDIGGPAPVAAGVA